MYTTDTDFDKTFVWILVDSDENPNGISSVTVARAFSLSCTPLLHGKKGAHLSKTVEETRESFKSDQGGDELFGRAVALCGVHANTLGVFQCIAVPGQEPH